VGGRRRRRSHYDHGGVRNERDVRPPCDAFRSARVVVVITVQVRRWKIRWRNILEDVGVGRANDDDERSTNIARGGGGIGD